MCRVRWAGPLPDLVFDVTAPSRWRGWRKTTGHVTGEILGMVADHNFYASDTGGSRQMFVVSDLDVKCKAKTDTHRQHFLEQEPSTTGMATVRPAGMPPRSGPCVDCGCGNDHRMRPQGGNRGRDEQRQASTRHGGVDAMLQCIPHPGFKYQTMDYPVATQWRLAPGYRDQGVNPCPCPAHCPRYGFP